MLVRKERELNSKVSCLIAIGWILYIESFCNITIVHLETIGVVEHIVGFWD
jgi:hypothetical protein